jgi:hypothetical protein
MLPDFKLLLIDSLPPLRETLAAFTGMPGPQAIVEAYQDPAAAMAALLREPASGRPSLAVVPLTPSAGQDPTVLAAALLNATSESPRDPGGSAPTRGREGMGRPTSGLPETDFPAGTSCPNPAMLPAWSP